VGAALAILAVMWAAVTAYALLGGADFGAGIWDLLAGGRAAGAPRRALIAHAIGPVWEANHVWLIFVLVLMWTAFPAVFAAVSSTLYVPLTAIALGVIARGAAFAFRKAIDQPWAQRAFGAAFAFSSVVTPWFLGAAAGAVAAGRVPPGLARGPAIGSWLNPVSAVTGTFAVAACAFLAASYLAADARRAGDPALTAWFRRRALASGLVVGACSAAGLLVLHADAAAAYGRLTGHAPALVAAAAAAGVAAVALAARGQLVALRLAAAAAVAAVLWAWGAAQYPYLLAPGPGPAPRALTVAAAAAPGATLAATVICVAVGGALVLPSLGWLLVLAQRPPRGAGDQPPCAGRGRAGGERPAAGPGAAGPEPRH
jgi:cytochrome bd ubiquinol oxidase subunit II